MTNTTPLSNTITSPDSVPFLRPVRRSAVFAALIVSLALSGCAAVAPGADGVEPGATGSESDGTDSSGSDDAGEGDQGSGAAAVGTITVATTTYDVVEVVNCEPEQASELVTEVFDVIALGQSSAGDDVLFFATTQEQSGVNSNFIDYQGPEGTWSTPGGTATFTVSDGVLSGASAIVNAEETETVTIQFRFEVPAELVDCG